MPPTPPSNSGIQKDSTGASYVPSSTRADGSTRKEIRVRPGYRPLEDVEVYKNRTAEAFKNRGKGGVPGAEIIEKQDNPKSKNAKRREAARQKLASEVNVAEWDQKISKHEGSDGVSKDQDLTTHLRQPETENPNDLAVAVQAPILAGEEVEREKKARNLKKKLRQARELQTKKESGESLLPEQFAKVLKIQELIRDLEKLGFDEDGDKKTSTDDG